MNPLTDVGHENGNSVRRLSTIPSRRGCVLGWRMVTSKPPYRRPVSLPITVENPTPRIGKLRSFMIDFNTGYFQIVCVWKPCC